MKVLSIVAAIFAVCSGWTLQSRAHVTQTPNGIQQPAPSAQREVRGTWLTTTANSALETPENVERTMATLADIGINTVYVECWKNGYTQFPSETLKSAIGVERKPSLVTPQGTRDLVRETLDAAKANNLTYIAWFEYGFMAAYKETQNHLRLQKREWLSLDREGNEVAPNGFVWMNPLHPECQQFLTDLILECIEKYPVDGIQLDDRIVWPYVTMGYDEYTKKVYAAEHNGASPPEDHKDPEWMQWRSKKIDEFSKRLVTQIRAKRPDILISLSPAVYPWCYEHYLLNWPAWSDWKVDAAGSPRWDEFIPQCYRIGYDAFEKTWLSQVEFMKSEGGGRVGDLLAGIRVVGEGRDATWDELRRSIQLTRRSGAKGHVLWFSRGVLETYPKELKEFYSSPATEDQEPQRP